MWNFFYSLQAPVSLSKTVTNVHFAKCFINIFHHCFKSPHICWTKHSWLMDSINLMASKPGRENMFMRSIIPIERHWKQQHYWKMKGHLFSSAVDVLVFIPEDGAGLLSEDANDVLPSAEITHQSVCEPPFPVIIPLRQPWWTEGGERVIRPPNLYPTCLVILC